MQFFKPLNAVKAMTFDLDDTLYDNEPIIRRADAALQAHIAKYHKQATKLTPKDWLVLKRAAIRKDKRLASDMGRLRKVVLAAALSGTPASQLSTAPPLDGQLSADVEACFNCFYDARSDFTLDENVHRVLHALSQHIPLGGITNGNVDTQKIGIDNYFKTVLHASTQRPMKPSPAMFDEASQLLNIKPKYILHVGDNLIKDVKGAVNAGYQSAWFACNRSMNLANEPVTMLPHLVLNTLDELLAFI